MLLHATETADQGLIALSDEVHYNPSLMTHALEEVPVLPQLLVCTPETPTSVSGKQMAIACNDCNENMPFNNRGSTNLLG